MEERNEIGNKRFVLCTGLVLNGVVATVEFKNENFIDLYTGLEFLTFLLKRYSTLF